MNATQLGIQELIVGLRHVGYITADLAATLAHWKRVYELRDEQVVVVPPFGTPCDTRFAFIDLAGTQFELIEAVSEHFRAILLADRPGINHVAWVVRDLEAAVARMAQNGVRLGHVTPDGIVVMPRFKMAYFDPRDTGGMLIELIEPRA